MKDRISTRILDNGAVRYAVYDENGAFLRHEYIKIDDEPTQEGTPLTKKTILTDDTARKLFLNGDPDINDAFNMSSGDIGDIKISIKSSVGEDWVIANGHIIDENIYADAESVFPVKTVFDDWVASKTMPELNTSDFRERLLVSDGEYFVALSTSDKSVYFTKSPFDEWEQHVIPVLQNYGSINYAGLYFLNGKWIISAYCNTSGGNFVNRIFYSDKFDGEYVQSGFSISSSYKIYGVFYLNGEYIVTTNAKTAAVFASEDLSSWRSYSIADSADIYAAGYKNGSYFFSTKDGASLYHTTDLGTAATAISLTASGSGHGYLYNIDGRLFLLQGTGIYEIVDAANVRKIQELPTNYSMQSLAFINGKWIAANYAGVYISADESIESEFVRVVECEPGAVASVAFNSPYYVGPGNLVRGIGVEAPEIIVDGCNVFIRAKK